MPVSVGNMENGRSASSFEKACDTMPATECFCARTNVEPAIGPRNTMTPACASDGSATRE